MKLSDLNPAEVCYGGKRIIIEDGKTVRIEMQGVVGNFDGKTIWRYRYVTGPRAGQIKETYCLPSMFLAYNVCNGKLVPAGRLVAD